MAKRKSKYLQEGNGYRVFTVINTLFMLLVIIATAYPVYYVLVASFSNPEALSANPGFLLAPLRPLSVDAYRRVFQNPLIMSGYRNTIVILLLGLAVNLVMTSLGAYFLSLKNVLLRVPISVMVLFTMYFSGGLIPEYLNIRGLGLMDSIWALVIPGAISTYNLLILRSAFAAVPDSLTEAAKLDGANHFHLLLRVLLPLTRATMAVLVLYYGVAHWNAWFNASIYIQDGTKWPLQLVLRHILISNQTKEMIGAMDTGDAVRMAEMIKYALIVVSTAPILFLYPFLQRFFVRGVMIGALKG